MYNVDKDIYGVQFIVHGVIIDNVYVAENWYTTWSESMVFSLAGLDGFPLISGSGVLATIYSEDAGDFCISDIVIAGETGNEILNDDTKICY